MDRSHPFLRHRTYEDTQTDADMNRKFYVGDSAPDTFTITISSENDYNQPANSYWESPTKMFFVRDNAGFGKMSSSPTLYDARNSYDNSTYSTEHTLSSPVEQSYTRAPSPRRILLRGINPSQDHRERNQQPGYSLPSRSPDLQRVRQDDPNPSDDFTSPFPYYENFPSGKSRNRTSDVLSHELKQSTQGSGSSNEVFLAPQTRETNIASAQISHMQEKEQDMAYGQHSADNLSYQLPPSSPGLIPTPPPIPDSGIPTVFTSSSSQPEPTSSLAAALQSAKLKKTSHKPDTAGIPPALVGTKAILMEEMQRKLGIRKARSDGEGGALCNDVRISPNQSLSRSNTASPSPLTRKPSSQGLTSINGEPDLSTIQPAVAAGRLESGITHDILPRELEQLKKELMDEIRMEMQQMKCEILAAIDKK